MRSVYDAIEDVARNDLKLDVYTNQIEIISSEQMLDAYSSIGMPLMYRHWSFGKHFVTNERYYRKGAMGLAYEIVINSDPLHQLLYGGKLHADADPGDGACRLRSQSLLQGQSPVSPGGPMPAASLTIWNMPAATLPNARKFMVSRRSRRCSTQAMR